MRTFIAIELTKAIKDYLSKLQNELKTSQVDVNWVLPQNIHLTLKFLGEIDSYQLTDIIKIIEDIASDKTSFPIQISALGAFQKISFPRIIWAGIDKGDVETKIIAQELIDGLSKIGFAPEDRPFSTHITLGRVRSSKNREKLAQKLNELQNSLNKNMEFTVDKITLFKSTLTPQGPIYEIIKEISLRK